jgi:hypothetical protein
LRHLGTNIKLYLEDDVGEIERGTLVTIKSREFFTYPYSTESPYYEGFMLNYFYGYLKVGFDLPYGIILRSCDGFRSCLNISVHSHKITKFTLKITNVNMFIKETI